MRAGQYQALPLRGSDFFLGAQSGVNFSEMPSPAASPIPTSLLLVLMAIGAKRQRVDRRGSEAAGDGDECKGRDGEAADAGTSVTSQLHGLIQAARTHGSLFEKTRSCSSMGNAGRMCRMSRRAPPARTALACTATCARTEPPTRTAPTEAAASSRSSP
jgi:hypothetical protein